MRPIFLPIFIVCLSPAILLAETGQSALAALKLLPKDVTANLTSIQGLEGAPLPERWHFLVFDPKVESGVHEYVVSGSEVKGPWEVSQFAEELKEEDVIGAQAVKFDTDRALKVMQKYAVANDVTVATYNYELKKAGKEANWHLTCLDKQGAAVGRFVFAANKGTMVSRDGFPNEPAPETPKPERPKPPPSQRAYVARPPERFRSPEPPRERSGFLERVFGGGRPR